METVRGYIEASCLVQLSNFANSAAPSRLQSHSLMRLLPSAGVDYKLSR